MNKSGQILAPLFFIIGFFVAYFLFGYDMITTFSMQMIETNNLSGIEAFLVANLNIFTLVIGILSSLVLAFIGGSS